jgi:ADP-ribose diphosphatase
MQQSSLNTMPRKPTVHQRRQIADTGIFNIEEIDLEFANGQTRCYQRIVGSAQGAVLVIPLLQDETLLLIREYAAGMDRYELAFPKGKIRSAPPTGKSRKRPVMPRRICN